MPTQTPFHPHTAVGEHWGQDRCRASDKADKPPHTYTLVVGVGAQGRVRQMIKDNSNEKEKLGHPEGKQVGIAGKGGGALQTKSCRSRPGKAPKGHPLFRK